MRTSVCILTVLPLIYRVCDIKDDGDDDTFSAEADKVGFLIRKRECRVDKGQPRYSNQALGEVGTHLGIHKVFNIRASQMSPW